MKGLKIVLAVAVVAVVFMAGECGAEPAVPTGPKGVGPNESNWKSTTVKNLSEHMNDLWGAALRQAQEESELQKLHKTLSDPNKEVEYKVFGDPFSTIEFMVGTMGFEESSKFFRAIALLGKKSNTN